MGITPTDLKCPTCGAKPGERCDTAPVSIANRLERNPGRSHPARFDAAVIEELRREARDTTEA